MFNSLIPAQIFPVAVIFFMIMFYTYYMKIAQLERKTLITTNNLKLTFFNKRYPLEISDILPILIITVIFLVLATFNLGSKNPVDVLIETAAMSKENYTFSPHTENIYFDEMYFVRTAVEHIKKINQYEWTHPPLGKNIIALSILLFGESPFGWRIIGSVCGVLMLIAMYAFLKNMFGKTALAVCGTLLLGFDFLRLVQSRIGTTDTFLVTFILLSYYFMYLYITTNPDAPLKKSLPPLALSGLFFGLSTSVKWIGFYAGAGLLVLYIMRLVQLFMYYKNNNITNYVAYFIKTIAYTFVFFILIPSVIYYINYVPYGLSRGMTIKDGMLWNPRFIKIVLYNQSAMLHYHSMFSNTHFSNSVWWQWLFDIKPALYTLSYTETTVATFGAFGNPILYWGGLVAMIIMAIRSFTHRDGKALFILIGYLVHLLPWIVISRMQFAYHYQASSIFLVIALAHIFNTTLESKEKGSKAYVYGFTVISGITFAMFYPMLAGVQLSYKYFDIFIKWLPTWLPF